MVTKRTVKSRQTENARLRRPLLIHRPLLKLEQTAEHGLGVLGPAAGGLWYDAGGV
jgi:hypothetical protein